MAPQGSSSTKKSVLALAILASALLATNCGEGQVTLGSDNSRESAEEEQAVIIENAAAASAAPAETSTASEPPTTAAESTAHAETLTTSDGGDGATTGTDTAHAETSADSEPPTTATHAETSANGGEPPTTVTESAAPTDASARPNEEQPSKEQPPLGPRFPEPIPLRLVRIAELPQPLAMAVRPGEDALYVALREGRVVRLSADPGGGVLSSVDAASPHMLGQEVVLDLSDRVLTHNELGLLGITFSPDGRWFYTSSNAPGEVSEINEWPVSADGGIDDGRRRLVLSLQQPYGNHNGGDVTFGPDGYFYFALGDGGGSGDPLRTGQDRKNWLGSVLRINPRPTAEGQPYSVPANNPYADGVDGAPEVWLWGVRNPWRISFDSATGDLWVADVGQDELEEITRLPAESIETEGSYTIAGRDANLGWSAYEGSEPFWSQTEPNRHIRPIHEYRHGVDDRCSVTGGYVYRGESIEGLKGVYIFGDLCDAVIRGFTLEGGAEVLGLTVPNPLLSFGQGPAGEIYVMTTKALWRLEGG